VSHTVSDLWPVLNAKGRSLKVAKAKTWRYSLRSST
jgi:hypothetical protein